MDIVTQVLNKTANKARKFEPVDVEKHLDLDFDLGTLLAVDSNELDQKKLRSQTDNYLKNLARDNTQLLLNKIWELPTERVEEAVVAKLPVPSFVLPRQHPVPKPKPLSRWEKFAKEKGIKKRKKTGLKWDDVLKKWVPQYGYRRAAAQKEQQWVLEVPQNADPMEDQFTKKTGLKVERVAKNEFQRLRNIAASKNIKVPRAGLPTSEMLNSSQLGAAVNVAKVSTASIGRFQPKLPKEKHSEKMSPLLPTAKKRKLPPPLPDQEKKANLAMLDSILNKQPRVDMEKAVNRQMFQEQQARSNEKSLKPKKGKKGKRQAGNRGKKGNAHGKKPRASAKSGGKGPRKPNQGGRKRR